MRLAHVSPWILALAVVCLSAVQSPAATLEKLQLEEMARKSTEIVRGRVLSSSAAQHGALVYTDFQVEVVERWKGAEAKQVRVSVPGGTLGNIRQSFSGTPSLEAGAQYVFFLWTGSAGVTHIIGLSQGVFDLSGELGTPAKTQAMRAAIQEPMLDPKTGNRVNGEAIRLTLEELRNRVRIALEGAQ